MKSNVWLYALIAVLSSLIGWLVAEIITIKKPVASDEPEVLIQCKTDIHGEDLTCHFTNLSNTVTQECIVVGMKCKFYGDVKDFHSPEICSGWLSPLTTNPRDAESWNSPGMDGAEFPPEFATDCEPPYAVEHTTMTAEQFIDDNKNHPEIRWKF